MDAAQFAQLLEAFNKTQRDLLQQLYASSNLQSQQQQQNQNISNICLRAQFIRGLKDNTIREQLLQSEEAEFEKIIQRALSLEASKIDSREINTKQTICSDINKIQAGTSSRRRSRLKNRSSSTQRNSKSRLDYRKLIICVYVVVETTTKQMTAALTNITSNATRVEKEDISSIYGINQIVDIFSNEFKVDDIDKYYVEVDINGRRQKFEVDTGVGFTLIPRNEYEKLQVKKALQPSRIAFRSYTKNIIIPDGKINVRVKCNNLTTNEELYVVPSGHDALMGRVWIRHLKINLQQVDKQHLHNINTVEIYKLDSISDIINEFNDVFTEKIGCVNNYEVTLQLRQGSKPVFYKEREVPYALRERVEKELNELEAAGIISKCERSDWGSPLVIIPKPDGGIRLCVDYKPGVNPQLVSSNYPIRRIDEILNNLKGSKYFCRLDLYKAYLHLRVNPESSEIQTMSTHKGTYRVNRLSFGIKTAPSEFNRIIEQILSGLDKTMSYFDDIIIHGSTEAECKRNLILCLKRLQQHVLHLNRSKCSFFQTQIEYLGHIVRYNDVDVDDKNSTFYWSSNCEASFIKLKNIISSDQVLMPFDPERPVIVACDASPTGIAGVL
ncbi:uncharacterized protein K02A2.6-like [Lucilia sericata]|uniref:uncharacterized protein K02A2.6-like n=1 Tax=Lucilia sericata TaxID=13632 RepID=UPI0018A87CC1|nr:uncharacterized protein K02A2.6-like [Lucilia sericata]